MENPDRYPPEEINPRNGVSFKQLYERTLQREEDLRLAGYNLVVKWV